MDNKGTYTRKTEAGKTSGGRPEGRRTEGRRTEGRRPEGQRPEGRRPESDRSRTRRPEGQRPEGQRAEVGRPEGQRPEGQRAEVGRPEGQRPEGQRPEGFSPERERGQAGWSRFGRSQTGRSQFGRSQFDRSRFGRNRTDKVQTGDQPDKLQPGDEARLEDDIIEGRNPVLEAIKAGRPINRIIVTDGDKEGSIRMIIAMARDAGIPIKEIPREKLKWLSETGASQGVIAYAAAKEYVEVDDILEIAKTRGEDVFILILDGIEDPHNLGSIIRSADLAGVQGVVIPKRRAVALTPAVSKAAAGALEYMPVARVVNISQTIDRLKEKGIWVAGTDASGDTDIFGSRLKGNLAIVVGGEEGGIGKLVRERCDFIVKIPMKGHISSLNASVAAAVTLFEAVRQRRD